MKLSNIGSLLKYFNQLTKLAQKVSNSKIVFSIYCLIIIVLVTLPLNSTRALNDITILRFRGGYFIHALLFLPWAFIQISKSKQWILWFIIGFLFATTSELIQFFLTYRAFNIHDLFANTIGVAMGFILLFSIKNLNNNFTTTQQ